MNHVILKSPGDEGVVSGGFNNTSWRLLVLRRRIGERIGLYFYLVAGFKNQPNDEHAQTHEKQNHTQANAHAHI